LLNAVASCPLRDDPVAKEPATGVQHLHNSSRIRPAIIQSMLIQVWYASICCHRAAESAVDAVSVSRSETATSRVPYYNLIMPVGT